jgi:hypothetical protein
MYMSYLMKSLAKYAGLLVAVGLAACAVPGEEQVLDGTNQFDPEPEGEGVAFDEQHPGADPIGKADQPKTYDVPTDLPELERPEIIVSLDGLTVHLFDRATGVSRVYPAGVGMKGSSGNSYTPRGFFRTHEDPSNYWYNIPRRYNPSYFGGFPFLRLDAENSNGNHTYGFHGPISYSCPGEGDCGLIEREWFLKRDFVSHGCMRMNEDDIVDMFYMVRGHASVPVSIQRDVERDANDEAVDIDTAPTVWDEGATISYGDCGERPDPYDVDGRWDSPKCEVAASNN